MANKTRAKMDISNRAKQFMPFAALKGFPEALAAKEKERAATAKPALLDENEENPPQIAKSNKLI